jgi:hypothetical protein
MEIRLISHINGDGDLLGAWFRHYRALGVSSFHLVVHGPRDENEVLYEVKKTHPVVIEDAYQGQFSSEEKKERLNAVLARMRGNWIIVADSDEFVEFPYRRIDTTVRMLRLIHRTALFGPMVQHLSVDGSLVSPETVEDPFKTFPLCSVDLYEAMGVKAAISKWPLFYCGEETALREGGNHNCPTGNTGCSMQGATHHFKFRRAVTSRLQRRASSAHTWRHESAQFRQFLEEHGNLLPTSGAFQYSRAAMFERRLLRRFSAEIALTHLKKVVRQRSAKGVAVREIRMNHEATG